MHIVCIKASSRCGALGLVCSAASGTVAPGSEWGLFLHQPNSHKSVNANPKE